MASPKKVIFASLSYAWYGKLASGAYYPAGLTGSLTPGAATGGGLVRLQGMKQASLTLPESTRVTQTGDAQPQGTFIFAPVEDVTGQITMGILDLDYENMVQGTLAYNLNNLQISPMAPGDPDFVDHLMLISRPAKSKEAATTGLGRWLNYLVPIMNASPRGDSGISERELADALYDLVGNKTGTFPWGDALDSANVGTTEAAAFRIISEYPLMIDVFVSDNSETEYTLSKIPVGDMDSVYFNSFDYSDGSDADDELTSVSTTTGLVTYTSAIADNAVRLFLYQWDPAAN